MAIDRQSLRTAIQHAFPRPKVSLGGLFAPLVVFWVITALGRLPGMVAVLLGYVPLCMGMIAWLIWSEYQRLSKRINQ